MVRMLAYENQLGKYGGLDAITVWFSVDAEHRKEFYVALVEWLEEKFGFKEEAEEKGQ